ncbi:MAG: succinate dehydrogenase cytochrome b subunit [Ignavibacteriales bacterium]|nr:succinate dehydrogenase cytochrome b subunit [Ignavibacteriales bacterium]
MSALLSFYQSSIGKKFFMSITGLFLCLFLLEHAVGNSLLFLGKEIYEAYSEALVKNPVIRTIEIGLFLSLLVHPMLGGWLWFVNRRSRPVKYDVYQLKENAPWYSRSTMLTGLTIFGFLLLHLYSFFFKIRFTPVHPSGYDLVVHKFQDPLFVSVYVVCIGLLGFHLRHGFQSGSQTLGLRNKKYTPLIDKVAFLFWFIIPAVFISLPIYFYFFWRPAMNGAMTAWIF